ncbi:hypothetical protein BUE80_DR012394, partial [Diplocarpon rosae]
MAAYSTSGLVTFKLPFVSTGGCTSNNSYLTVIQDGFAWAAEPDPEVVATGIFPVLLYLVAGNVFFGLRSDSGLTVENFEQG